MHKMGTTIRNAGNDTHSPIRAMHSLSQVQALGILAGLVSLPKAWSVEPHESCDGHLSLVISDTVEDTTLIVDQDAKGLRVGFMMGDELHSSQTRYPSVNAAVRAVTEFAGNSNTATATQRHTA